MPHHSIQLFVSYRRLPSAMLATLIATQMQERGIHAFVDTRQTDGGGPFPDRLLRAIEDADVFICLLADTTLESEWVRREIQHAHEQHKLMIPVFQESYARPDPLPNEHVEALLQNDGIHILDQKNLYVDQAMDQLATMARASVQKSGSLSPRVIAASALLIVVLVAALLLLLAGRDLFGGAPTPTLRPVAQLSTVQSEMTVTAETATAVEEDRLAAAELASIRGTGTAAAATRTQVFAAANATLTATAQTTPLPTANLTSALPDLYISQMRMAPRNPAPGQVSILSFTIANLGGADSGAFTWDFSVISPIPVLNAMMGEIDNLAPGASKNISFPYIFGNWGTANVQLEVNDDQSVPESDFRNDLRLFIVDLTGPLDIDFSVLPNSQMVEPPLMLTGNEFLQYDLTFQLDTHAHPECADTPLSLLQDGDHVVLTADTQSETCEQLPLIMDFLQPISGVDAVVVPIQSGTATLRLYDDLEGADVVYETTIEAQAGELTTLSSPPPDPDRLIRRAELSLSGQPVVLTRLIVSS